MTAEIVKKLIENKTNIDVKNLNVVSETSLGNGDVVRVIEDNTQNLNFETVEHKDGYIHFKCIKGNSHDVSLDNAEPTFKKFKSKLSNIEYVMVEDSGEFYLVPKNKHNHPVFGPFDEKNFAEEYSDTEMELIHYPKDLFFDVMKDGNMVVIVLASLIKEDHDNLGSHNVVGLPYNLEAEDMENNWSVIGKTMTQVKNDMKACGFKYRAFL